MPSSPIAHSLLEYVSSWDYDFHLHCLSPKVWTVMIEDHKASVDFFAERRPEVLAFRAMDLNSK